MSYTLPTSDTRAHVREDFDPSVADRAILELFSLPRCEETIELTRQSVALPSQPSVIGAHSLAEFTQRLPPPSKSRIAYHDIPREADRPPLRWVQVEAPSQPVLEWLAASFSIKRSDILSSLLPDRPAQSYRYGDYLVNSYAELSFNESNPLKIVESRILAILAEDFLITISPKESTSCRRVTEELFEESLESLEVGSSNHLFSRLLGSSLHVNEEAAFILEEAAEKFSEMAAEDGPTTARRAEYAHLKRSIFDAERALQNNPEVIHSLKEERNLFGSEKPRAALERYQVIQASSESRLRQAEQFLTLCRDDWRITQDEHRNGILFRLAVLGGALSPTALAASLFGMNFPEGLPYSTGELVLGICASAAISCFLVGALLFKRAFPNRRNQSIASPR